MSEILKPSKSQTNLIRRFPPIGLSNQTGSCYVNCCIQVLFHLPLFRKMIFECSDQIRDDSCISFRLATIFSQMQSSMTCVDTSQFKLPLEGFPFNMTQMDDYTLFYSNILNFVQTELNNTKWMQLNSLLFLGHIRQESIGHDANQIQMEPFFDIRLNIRPSFHFHQAMKERFSTQAVEVKEKDNSQHSISLTVQLPSVLSVHVNRWMQKDGTFVKDNAQLPFPLEFDFSDFASISTASISLASAPTSDDGLSSSCTLALSMKGIIIVLSGRIALIAVGRCRREFWKSVGRVEATLSVFTHIHSKGAHPNRHALGTVTLILPLYHLQRIVIEITSSNRTFIHSMCPTFSSIPQNLSETYSTELAQHGSSVILQALQKVLDIPHLATPELVLHLTTNTLQIPLVLSAFNVKAGVITSSTTSTKLTSSLDLESKFKKLEHIFEESKHKSQFSSSQLFRKEHSHHNPPFLNLPKAISPNGDALHANIKVPEPPQRGFKSPHQPESRLSPSPVSPPLTPPISEPLVPPTGRARQTVRSESPQVALPSLVTRPPPSPSVSAPTATASHRTTESSSPRPYPVPLDFASFDLPDDDFEDLFSVFKDIPYNSPRPVRNPSPVPLPAQPQQPFRSPQTATLHPRQPSPKLVSPQQTQSCSAFLEGLTKKPAQGALPPSQHKTPRKFTTPTHLKENVAGKPPPQQRKPRPGGKKLRWADGNLDNVFHFEKFADKERMMGDKRGVFSPPNRKRPATRQHSALHRKRP
ncbi:hypothetical protein BLNAU_8744 [Blattamonas nauphoetae]|uniref:USP domain-containing protein n=1 Tax=Blattamonas nauphoetae TaxID=2049346 RepID=A0ABQ9XXH6_9EUKA|nr:hypothetical protein BLNAU_8744 [Blattamonas nauphoetae]